MKGYEIVNNRKLPNRIDYLNDLVTRLVVDIRQCKMATAMIRSAGISADLLNSFDPVRSDNNDA